MKDIKYFEPVTTNIVNAIASSLGNIGAMIARLSEVDIEVGAGVIDKRTKCLWTKDGHRIEIWLGDGGDFGASVSKEVDPLKPSKPWERIM